MYNLDAIDPLRKLFGLAPVPKPVRSPRGTTPGLAVDLCMAADEALLVDNERQEEEEEDMIKGVEVKKEMETRPGPQASSVDKGLEKELAALGIFVKIR